MNLQTIPRRPNYLINGGFEFAQRVNTGLTNGQTEYVNDRWYITNSLGTNGVISASTPPLNPSAAIGGRFGAFPIAAYYIATAPTASQANGLVIYHTLERRDSMVFYNNLATFAIWVQSYGAYTTQVGITFMYKTTEAKVDTTLSNEYLFTISAANWTRCVIQGFPVGTTMTTSGVLGIRIRQTAVSTGNLYDVGQGLSLAQAMLVPGAVVPKTFERAGITRAGELALCQRYYEKTYNVDTALGGASSYLGHYVTNVMNISVATAGTYCLGRHPRFKVEKRATPTVYLYNADNGSIGSWNIDGATDVSAGASEIGTSGFTVVNNTGAIDTPAAGFAYGHWVADAEI